MSEEEKKMMEQIYLEQCRVMCPRCNAKWVTSLGVPYCDCLICGTKLDPKKHIIADRSDMMAMANFVIKGFLDRAERYVDDCSVDAVKRDDGLSIEEAIKTQVRLDFLNHLKDWAK